MLRRPEDLATHANRNDKILIAVRDPHRRGRVSDTTNRVEMDARDQSPEGAEAGQIHASSPSRAPTRTATAGRASEALHRGELGGDGRSQRMAEIDEVGRLHPERVADVLERGAGVERRTSVRRRAGEPIIAAILRKHDTCVRLFAEPSTPTALATGDVGVAMKREHDRPIVLAIADDISE